MNGIPKSVLYSLVPALWILFTHPALAGQDDKGYKNERKTPEEVILTFEGEQLTEPEEAVDAKALLRSLVDKMGGYEAYKGIKDLKFKFKSRAYMEDGSLRNIVTATQYMQLGDRVKTRMDFDYPSGGEDGRILDYREVMGEDGPFKYLEGKVLKRPDCIRLAGENLWRNELIFLTPFFLDLNEGDPRYMGVASWKEKEGEKVREVKCHKILIQFKGKQANVQGNLLALYIDMETGLLRRQIFELFLPTGRNDRFKIIDYQNRLEVEGLSLPTQLLIQNVTTNQGEVIHKIRFSDFEVNTGLPGIGFEMANQQGGG
jgi:hypothetical protein